MPKTKADAEEQYRPLSDPFWFTGGELDEFRFYDVSQERVWYTMGAAYERVANEPVTPTPTVRQKSTALREALDDLGLPRWCEMDDDEREHFMADVMADLLWEVAGDA